MENRTFNQAALMGDERILKIIATLATSPGRTLQLRELSTKVGVPYSTTRILILKMKEAEMVHIAKVERGEIEVTLKFRDISITLRDIVRKMTGSDLPEGI